MNAGPRPAPEKPAATIKAVDGGPLQVKGDFEVGDHDGAVYGTRRTAFLCRCGHSAAKPFCYGTHKRVGFAGDERVAGDGEGE
jgi:CDGSH-type Zn-finger protein